MPVSHTTNLEIIKVGTLYCELMEEITIRDELLNAALNGQFPQAPAISSHPHLQDEIVAEFCYLQLRMICELIAVSCLAVHGDIDGTRTSKITAARKADWIINALEKLHPEFYPVPCKQTIDANGKVTGWTDMSDPCLTKPDLVKLYHEAGDWLHQRSFKQLSHERDEPNFPRLKVWADGIWRLLEHHKIQLIDPSLMLAGLMKAKETTRAQFSFWIKEPAGRYRCLDAVSLDQKPNRPFQG